MPFWFPPTTGNDIAAICFVSFRSERFTDNLAFLTSNKDSHRVHPFNEVAKKIVYITIIAPSPAFSTLHHFLYAPKKYPAHILLLTIQIKKAYLIPTELSAAPMMLSTVAMLIR